MAAPAANAANAGVNMIYPPKRAADFDKPDVAPQATKTVVKVKVYVRPNIHRYLRERQRFYTNRALFQNYPWLRKEYGGRRYPF
ncbi:MAG: hypothetical protein ACR2OM_05800 [Aestuariivirgaceae bacterium]